MRIHQIDLLLGCANGHTPQIVIETIEAAIFAPMIGEARKCPKCDKMTTIVKVGTPFWIEVEEQKEIE